MNERERSRQKLNAVMISFNCVNECYDRQPSSSKVLIEVASKSKHYKEKQPLPRKYDNSTLSDGRPFFDADTT